MVYRTVTLTMNSKLLEKLILANHRSLELFAAQWTAVPEDCVQEAFLKLHRTTESIDNPRAWLFRVVRNLAIDAGRSEASRKRREQLVGQSKSWFVEQQESPFDISEIQSALQKLPAEQREIIVARIWGKLTLKEIASAFQIATSTVHRRYELGIKQLQNQFSQTSTTDKP